MNLSLQLKKFINSENVGLYTEIVVPSIHREEGVPLNIHYMDAGSGEPLILVHGIGQSCYTWRGMFSPLSEHFRVLAVELPGHGYSTKPAYHDYSISDQAAALRLFMDSIGIASAHFVAFSSGCAYVTELAKQHPEIVGRIVLLSPGGLTAQMPAFMRMLDSPLFSIFASLTISPRRVESALFECFLDLTTITPEMVNEYFITLASAESRRALRYSVRGYDYEESIKGLRDITAPTLILWSSDDKWRTVEMSEAYHAAMPNAGFAVIRNAGHLLHEEQPEKVVAAVLGFIPAVSQEETENTQTQTTANAESTTKTGAPVSNTSTPAASV